MLLFVRRKDEQACDALIETGAELAARRPVSPDAWAFPHRPRSFSTLADATAGIVAVQAGEAGTNSP